MKAKRIARVYVVDSDVAFYGSVPLEMVSPELHPLCIACSTFLARASYHGAELHVPSIFLLTLPASPTVIWWPLRSYRSRLDAKCSRQLWARTGRFTFQFEMMSSTFNMRSNVPTAPASPNSYRSLPGSAARSSART